MDTVKNAVERVVLPFIDALSHERGELLTRRSRLLLTISQP
jgi:hypothetical protein